MEKIPLKMILGTMADSFYCTGFPANAGPRRTVKNRRDFNKIDHGLWYVDYYEPFEYKGKMWKVIELYDDHTMLVEEIIDDSTQR